MERRTVNRRTVLTGALAGSVVLATASCGRGSADANASADGDVRIGVLAELSGPLAAYGEVIDRSARLAVAQINARGGLLGRQLSVTTVDTGTSAAKAADLAKQLVQRENVDLVIGPAGSDENDAAARVVAEQNNRLYFFTEGYEGGKCAPTYFAFSNVPAQQRPFVEFLQQESGPKAFLFGADYVWPQKVFAALKDQIATQGGEVVGELYLPTVADNFTQLVDRLRSAKPDYVYCLYPAVFNAALQAMTDAGLTGTFVLGNSFVSDAYLPSLGASTDGMYSFLSYSRAIPDEPAATFLASYQQAYGADALPGANESVSTYDSVFLYAQAVEQAGSTEAAKVASALVGQTVDGPTGVREVTDSHHCVQSAAVVQATGGRYEYVRSYENLAPGPQGSCS